MMPGSETRFMAAALIEARKAFAKGEVPVGAVAVIDGKIVARAHNQRESRCDPLGHAEINLLRKLSHRLKRWRLGDVAVAVTLEPCLMCLGALIQARIQRLIYGADDPVAGAITKHAIAPPTLPFTVRSGLLKKKGAEILRLFFQTRRKSSVVSHEFLIKPPPP